tara:strand:+ start:37 stop:246 length:210 start_codon:yes stop_codon:yes gene_type:complete
VAPNKATNADINKPNPQAKAQATPDDRPEPMDVAIVLSTFGPGTKTLRIKKPKGGRKFIIGIIKSNIVF